MITFGNLILRFFSRYLANEKGYSPETIASYSDCIRLLIGYCCKRLKITVDKLEFEMMAEQVILDFLDYLEEQRNNVAKTRNQRLAAIKSFFRFSALQEPTLTAVCERICNISVKRVNHKVIESLDDREVNEILVQPDTEKLSGVRDKALLALLYNTGARVQEIVDLNISDLNMDNPKQLTLTGKGKKQRVIPLYSQTIDAINYYITARENAGFHSEALFLNAKGQRISRFGITYLIREYAAKAAQRCPSLANKNVTPHTFRHTTALHLIQSGVDITVVKDWLGHADIKTTSLYLEINIAVKRQALEACPPPTALSNPAQPPQWQKETVLRFLQSLSRKAALC